LFRRVRIFTLGRVCLELLMDGKEASLVAFVTSYVTQRPDDKDDADAEAQGCEDHAKPLNAIAFSNPKGIKSS
jgi:hypothetical protein